jgi:hypothetical protein
MSASQGPRREFSKTFMKIILLIPGLAAWFFLASLQAQPVPPALSVSTMGGNQMMLSWAVTNTTFGLEYADSPDSAKWCQVKANVTNDLCIVMDSPTNSARFYRLVSPFGTNLPPVLPAARPMYANGDPYYGEGYEWDPNFGSALFVNIDRITDDTGMIFDATEIIDPASPTNNSLAYIWTVDAEGGNPDLISPYMTGTATAKLSFASEVLPDGEYLFYVTVTSKYSGLATTVLIDADTLFGGSASNGSWRYGQAVPRYEGSTYGYSEVVGFY